MTTNPIQLTRTQRAALVGQYHARKAFGDLRIWASWYNGLNSTERSFVSFYQQINRPGALESADIETHTNRSFTVEIKVDTEAFARSVSMLRKALESAHVTTSFNFTELSLMRSPQVDTERLARLRFGAQLLALDIRGHGLPVWFCDVLERHTPTALLPDILSANLRRWRRSVTQRWSARA